MSKAIFRFLLIALILAPNFSPVLFAANQFKTIESLVYASSSQVVSTVNAPFSVFIGDDLTGVTNPVKSAFFTVTGIYTGGGTLGFKIDNDAASFQSYTLPSVGTTPTSFTILYKDPADKIHPSSSGTYNYTLNLLPNAITISGLGAKFSLTYEYNPGACPDGTGGNEKMKTITSLVYASSSQVVSTVNAPFSVFIGDDLTGVTNPVKSAFFTVTGIYTGGGTLGFKIDNDAASFQSYTLPSVGTTPTSFTILYKDPADKIHPSSSGTYNYTLNILPNAITISGLGAKLDLTYRYKAPPCGAGFATTGDVYSTVFDTTGVADGPAYNSIFWKGQLGGPVHNLGKVRFQFAASDNSGGPWNFVGGDTCGVSDFYDPGAADVPIELKCFSAFNNKRYFRYRIQLCSNNCIAGGIFTPQVDDVYVSWSP